MIFEKTASSELEIKELRCTVREDEVQLTWFWPKEVDFVYIYKAPADDLRSLNDLNEHDLKLYTREEYKANHGYIARLESIGKYKYVILPCQKRDGRLLVFKQDNEDNLIYITGGKAKIYYSISYKKKLFAKRKRVKMSIMTELPLEKEMLCYVKKRDAVPISLEDGTWFPFIQEFASGRTELPEIEVDENEFIRIFFSNGKKAAEIFELIPQS